MNLSITKNNTQAEAKRNAAFWPSIIGAVVIAGIFTLGYTSRQEKAIDLQTAPWQTLLFIDHSTKNL